MLGNLQAQHDIEAASEEKGRAKVDFANQFSGDLKLLRDDDDSIETEKIANPEFGCGSQADAGAATDIEHAPGASIKKLRQRRGCSAERVHGTATSRSR